MITYAIKKSEQIATYKEKREQRQDDIEVFLQQADDAEDETTHMEIIEKITGVAEEIQIIEKRLLKLYTT